jgi:S-ribosylhomocysteine lyase
MERIASFSVDHNKLSPGIYLSREDKTPSGDTVRTYDVRMCAPNRDPVLSIASAHTLEHLGATYLRNHAEWSSKTIYFGPMGCRTGMYVLFSGEPSGPEVVKILQDMYQWVTEFPSDEQVPGATAAECGNYRDHNLTEAQKDAAKFLEIIKNEKDLGMYTYL